VNRARPWSLDHQPGYVTLGTVTQPSQAPIRAEISWADVDDLPIVAASHCIVQAAVHDTPKVNDVVVTLGYLAPPVFLGTPEQVATAARELTQVKIRPSARFLMSIDKAEELAAALQQIVNAARPAQGHVH
jgi:hypothetical protein